MQSTLSKPLPKFFGSNRFEQFVVDNQRNILFMWILVRMFMVYLLDLLGLKFNATAAVHGKDIQYDLQVCLLLLVVSNTIIVVYSNCVY